MLKRHKEELGTEVGVQIAHHLPLTGQHGLEIINLSQHLFPIAFHKQTTVEPFQGFLQIERRAEGFPHPFSCLRQIRNGHEGVYAVVGTGKVVAPGPPDDRLVLWHQCDEPPDAVGKRVKIGHVVVASLDDLTGRHLPVFVFVIVFVQENVAVFYASVLFKEGSDDIEKLMVVNGDMQESQLLRLLHCFRYRFRYR